MVSLYLYTQPHTLKNNERVTHGGFGQFFSHWYLYRNRYKCVESQTCKEKYHEKKKVSTNNFLSRNLLICFVCLLQETYPNSPPVWFSESEDLSVTSALSSLSETSGHDNHLLQQVTLPLAFLCAICDVYIHCKCVFVCDLQRISNVSS